MKDLIVITGPTASGKTEVSIKLAQAVGGEIVNADSMQVYKYMDIGTAKPTKEERKNIPHHLIDIIMPDENFSVAKYCEYAKQAIDDIHSRGKIPIMVGGTGLYVDSVVNNIQFTHIKPDIGYRQELEEKANTLGNKYLYSLLCEKDPQSAEKINAEDKKRIIRALEVYHSTGKTITWHNEQSISVPSPYNSILFAIDTDRAELYEKINRRVEVMFENGLAEEVKKLLDMGVNEEATSMQAIGYKETVEFLNGKTTMEQTVEKIKQSSRRYAKRQLTWFRRNDKIHWIKKDADEIIKAYKDR
ncbi:MAG: tRNA (adenosine(37)-N6)-dimethylallyltransferase MiaA [Clostridia bacterium]|nr:tRNA (adenosine(37)-N6)-dimethylallyltransferase MiaA [Clostridia bacterium]